MPVINVGIKKGAISSFLMGFSQVEIIIGRINAPNMLLQDNLHALVIHARGEGRAELVLHNLRG